VQNDFGDRHGTLAPNRLDRNGGGGGGGGNYTMLVPRKADADDKLYVYVFVGVSRARFHGGI